MSGLARVFDRLGQKVVPRIAKKVFPDLMYITTETSESDGAGGQIKTDGPDDYNLVPCMYEPARQHEAVDTLNAKMTSQERYNLTFPTHHLGIRIDIDPIVHRFEVQPRGNEPTKIFRIISIRDSSGVIFEANCVKEN